MYKYSHCNQSQATKVTSVIVPSGREELRGGDRKIISGENNNLKGCMHPDVHCSTIYNSQDMETT